ncbi:MAG TPA: hypothetical protein DCR40_00440 [Prolixibacteraceae bacterium]|nr:hypothetical protein [Prolixibacteraceae bacterium]
MKIVFNFKTVLIAIILIAIPGLIGYQPFLPKLVQTILIYSRLLLFGLYILFFLRNELNFKLLLLFLFYISILFAINPPSDLNYYGLVFLSVFSSLLYFKLGTHLINSDANHSYFKYLIFGINIFNISTLLVYYLLGTGYINATNFFEIAGKDNIELFRFSIGNPIEIPLLITALLYASIKLLPSTKNHMFSLSLNLIVTILSQSRIMVIVTVLMFLRELFRSQLKYKVQAVIIILACLPFLIYQFGDIVLSLFDRLSGNDAGSINGRRMLLQIFLDHINVLNLSFGNGLTSTLDLIKKQIGVYRTIESVLIQLIYELGILGTFLFVGNLFISKKKIHLPDIFDFVILLMYAQMFLFLPIFTLMPFSFFIFGICTKQYTINNKLMVITNMSRNKLEND